MFSAKTLLRYPAVLLTTLVFLVFSLTLNAGYLRWDDRQHIFENPWLLAGDWSLFWTQPYYGLYVPLIYNLWGIVYQISSEAWIFHLLNLCLHSINCWLVYRWCLQWNSKAVSGALLATLVFAIHPLQTEAVAWISASRDLLATTFALSSILFLSPNLTFTRSSHAIIALTFFVLGLLCKPTIALLPVALMMAQMILKTDRSTSEKFKSLRPFFSFIVFGLAFGILTIRIQSLDTAVRAPQIDFISRVLIAFDSLGFYLRKLFLPWPLSPEYGRNPEVVIAQKLWPPSLAAVLAFVGLIWLLRPQRRQVAAIVWALIMLSPTLGLLAFQAQFNSTVADRYFYLPMAGVALLLSNTITINQSRRVLLIMIATCAYSYLSFTYARIFTSDKTFYTHIWQLDPNNYNATVSLGVDHLTGGRFSEAESWLVKARELNPKQATGINALASLYFLTGRGDRILAEIEPLVSDNAFIDYNLTETRPVAALYRILALTHHQKLNWKQAHRYYCMHLAMDSSKPAVIKEFEHFLIEMKAATGASLQCPF